MATDLVGNVKLQRFIELLAKLNVGSAEFLQKGNTELLHTLRDVVEEMYQIQHVGKEDAYTAIEQDAQIIYQNFNAAATMLNSVETERADAVTANAVKKFIRNVFDATVRIIIAYGLA